MSSIAANLRRASHHALMDASRSTVLAAAAWIELLEERADFSHSMIMLLATTIENMKADIEGLRENATTALTDAEREAVEAAARIIDDYDEEVDGFSSGAAQVLRGLLERTK